MKIQCEHIDTGAKGIIISELTEEDARGNFPEQYGIFWTEKANSGKFANHYYWNDKTKIRIL